MNSQEHQFWVECQTTQDRITDQLLELGIAHGDKFGIKNESLNVDKRKKEIKGAVREKRRDPVRVM